MNTASALPLGTKKKIIDLPVDVCSRLAVQASLMGTSVKKLIESLVINSMSDVDDEAIYAYLCRTQPDGSELLDDEAQENLLASLRKRSTDE